VIAAVCGVIYFLRCIRFPGFFVMFLTALRHDRRGNASTFRMIPVIF
jgi:nitrate/nitrite transporter NarK